AGLGDALAVGDLGLADIGFHVELAAHAVYDDVQVQFAHAGDDGLTGFLIGPDPDGRILRRELAKGHAHFFLIRLGARLDGDGNHRLGEFHALQNDDLLEIAQGIASGGVLEADGRGDVPRQHFLDFLAVVAVHLHHAADALLRALDRVEHPG